MMKILILWLIEVIIELGIFHLWWVNIYMYERKCNVTIGKLIKDSLAFFRYLSYQKSSDKAMEDKRRILAYFLKAFILSIMVLLIIPGVFAFAFSKAGIILQIIFLLFFSGVSYDVIKKWPIARGFDEYIDFLKKYQKVRSGRSEKLYSKTDFTEVAFNDTKSILDNKTVYIIVTFVIIITASILIYYRVRNIFRGVNHQESTEIWLLMNANEKEIVAFCVLMMVVFGGVVIDAIILKREKGKNEKKISRKRNTVNWKKVKDSIIIDSQLRQWKDDIFQMCEHLHIKSVHIQINNSAKDIAEVTRQKDGVSYVQISKYYFEDMNQYFDVYLFKKVIMFIIGHELAHIYFHDRSKCRTVIIRIAIFMGYMLCLRETAILLYKCNLNGSIFYLIWALLVISIFVFIVSIIIDARYWRQIKELRADRVGMEASGTLPNVFNAYASYCQYLNGNLGEKGNPIYFYYEQYVEIKGHPSLETRSKELHRNKKWNITEHIRYCWIIRWKLWRHCGWKL